MGEEHVGEGVLAVPAPGELLPDERPDAFVKLGFKSVMAKCCRGDEKEEVAEAISRRVVDCLCFLSPLPSEGRGAKY